MDIGLDSIGRALPPQSAAVSPGVSPRTKPAESWKSRAVGSAELARVAGEEEVDEKELRRDDPLGNLVLRAFDPATAAAALRPLSIGAGE